VVFGLFVFSVAGKVENESQKKDFKKAFKMKIATMQNRTELCG